MLLNNETALGVTFPTLYKLTSKGALQMWEIKTDENVIITRWGQVGGALQTGTETIKAGKNTGKANETSPSEQAQAEAQSQWQKKLKKGYVQNPKDAQEGKTDAVIEGGIFPMLAQTYSKHAEKIVYPAYIQPKYDGHRMIADATQKGLPTLWSRTRKPITGLPHIVQAVELLDAPYVFDGEAYNHDYRNNFEDLTSFIRQETPKEGHEVVEYHIYDLAIPDMPFEKRTAKLQELLAGCPKYLKAVPTVLVNSEEEALLVFEEFLAAGYEGAILRNAKGLYVNKRSYDLQKLKEFEDSEFVVTGVAEGKGKLAGHAIFVCKCPGGEFSVKMKGETAKLKQYWENPGLAIGRELTVKYQGLTSGKKPRFPVAWRFKE